MLEPISEASSDDIPELCELLGQLFAMEADFAPAPEKQVAGLRLILERPDWGRIFVIRSGNRIAAMANLLLLSDKQAVLEDLIVRPEFRGRGLGPRLVNHVRSFASDAGFKAIRLLTDRTNETAIRTYRNAGFSRDHGLVFRRAIG